MFVIDGDRATWTGADRVKVSHVGWFEPNVQSDPLTPEQINYLFNTQLVEGYDYGNQPEPEGGGQ